MLRSRFAILILFFLTLTGWSWGFFQTPDCVGIYYDKSEDPKYNFGKVYSTFLQNLLGHFPQYQQIVSPVEFYKKGDMEKCKANFYIGSYFQNKIPADFIEDFKNTKKNFAWLGYNIWQLKKEDLQNILGRTYKEITKLDTINLDKNKNPSFYRYFKYKGESFEKFGKYVGLNADRKFHAAFELVTFQETLDDSSIDSSAKVLSTAQHSFTGDVQPYIINNKNFFYIADIPFSYIHESDRYLIFSDILFDVLGEQPQHPKKQALIRIEDVSAKSPLPELYQISKVFAEERIPLHISLIPIFFDPLNRCEGDYNNRFVPMTQSKEFMGYIESIKKQNAQFIWHGVTHQHGQQANPHNGCTSEDFEFWDAINNAPLTEDSVSFVLDRMQYGFNYLKAAGIKPVAWLTPHYQASALDYTIFARIFKWNVGRVIYFENTLTGLDDISKRPEYLQFESDAYSPKEQKNFFKNLKVEPQGNWSGQLYPYEIYGDVYGQRLFPEILGNPQPFESAHVRYPRSVDDILADAKRNLVLRDTWASLFFHPYLLTDWYNDGIGAFPGDVRPLKKLIRGLKDLGYEFVNIKDFAENNDALRPEPIYVQEGNRK